MVNINTHKPNIITLNRMAMRLGFLRPRILILLLVLVGWPGNNLSAQTVCAGATVSGTEMMDMMSTAPGQREGGTFSLTSTVPAGGTITIDNSAPSNENFVFSGFDATYTSYTFFYNRGPGYSVTINVSGTAPTVTLSSPDPTNVCSGNAIDLELTLSGVDGLFDVELTTNHPSGTTTSTLASSVAGVTHTLSYTLNADASFEITSVVDNSGTGCDVAPGDLPGPISFNVLPNASSQTVTGSSVCAPGSIGDIELQSSEVGVEYRLMYDDGINPPSTARTLTSATNGQAYTFIPAVTAVGSYTVQATGCAGGVAVVVGMTGGPFAISNAPTVYAITTPSPACVGSSLTLSGLEADVVYFLLRNNVRTGAFIDGSAGAIVFGGLSAGDYTVEAERNGCTQPMSGTLRVQATPQQFTLTTNKNSYCSGVANTGVELSLSGSQSGIKYQLQRNTGGGFLDYGTAVDGTNSALLSAWQNIPDGTYRVVARTSAGCTNNMTGRPVIIETIPPSAGISTSNPNSRCVGSTVDFFINVTLSGAQPFSFDIINNIGEPVISVSNYYSDTYSRQVNPASNVTYTLTNLTDASSCEPELNIGQVQFFVRPLPVFNFSSAPNPIGLVGGVPSTSICSGSPVTLEMQVSNTSGPYQYSWSHGLGNSVNVTFTPNATRTYDATVRNEYGCQDTKPVEVVVNSLPVIDFNLATGTNEVCENEGTVALIPVAPNTGGAFSGPGVTGSFFDPATAGASLIPHNISYTFQNTTTGCASTITKPIIVHPEPNVSVLGNQTNFCADQLTGTLSGNPQNSNGIWVLAAGARPWFSDNGNGRADINITGALADAGESSYTADYIYTDPTTGCVSDGNYLTFNVRDDLSNNVDFRLSGGGAIPATLCQDDSDIDLEAFFVNTGVVIADGTFSGPGISDNGNGTAIFSPDDAGTGTHVINYNYTDPATQCNGNASHSIQIGTTLTFNGGLSPIYCKEDAAFPIFGDPGPGTLEIFFESEATARFTQLNNSSTNQFTITPAAAAWESGDYTAVFTYSDGCDNVIEYDFTISDALDATFTVKDNQVQFCVTQDANPYNYVVELIPTQNGGTFTIDTPSGDGVEPNGTSFYPDVAQPGNYIITYTIQTGACSATYSLPVVVVGNPLVSISNLSDSYCENSPDFVISASNLPVVAGASYTFSATANAAGRVPIYEITKGDLDIPKEIDDTNVNFSPSYVGPGTYFITYTFDNTANAGCISTFVKEVEILEAPGVDFGVTDPVSGATITTLEFCQSASPLVLAGDIFTDPGNPLSSGTGFFTGVGIDNLIDGVGSGTNGRAGFDPSLVTPSDAHSITYSYTNYNGCQTQRTRDFKILAAPIDHYKVVSDPASGIYCFEAPPVSATYGVQIGLEFTQVDVTYHLLLDGVATVQTLAGRADGAGEIFSSRVTDEGTYTVRAVLDAVPPTSACVATMSGSVEVRRNYVTGTLDELINESCAGVADGFIKMSAGGGTAPYVFTLNTGTVSASGEFSGLAPGTYTVTIEDAVGCNWTSGNIVINPGNVIAISASDEVDVLCYGGTNGTFTVAATGLPSGNYEFLLSGSATWVSNGTGKYIFNNLPAGTYDVTVRDANSAGCQTVMIPSVVISQPTAAVSMANFVLTPVNCSLANTGGIEVEAAGGDETNGFNYVLYREIAPGFWVNIAASGAPVAFGTANTFTNLFAGNYRVVASDTKGCSVTAVYTVDGPTSLPSIILSGDEIVHVSQSGLSDGAIEVAISGGKEPYNIVWTEIDALGGATVGVPLTPGLYRQDNLAAGFYRITVTDDNGCNDVLEAEVLDDAVSAFDLTFTTVNPGPCNGSSNGRINLRAVGGITPYLSLSLTNGAGQVMTATTAGNSFANYENLQAGNYTATVVDTRGVSLSEVIILTQPAAPVVISHVTADATCFGGDGSVEFSVTGGTPTTGTPNTYTYSIIPTSGIPLTGTLDEAGVVTRNLPAGSYQLTVTDAVTCFDAVSFTINAPAQMGIVVEDVQNIKCFGGIDGEITVSVNGRPGGTAFTYEWQRYDEVSSSWQPDTETTATITDHAAGSYRVRAFEPGNPTCFSVWSGSISISQPLAAMVVTHTVNDITTCYGDNSGSIVLSVTGGTAPYIIKLGTNEYSWDGLNPYVLSGLSVGTYNIEVVDDSGCKQLITEPIAEPELFDVTNIDYGIECENLTSGYFTASIRGGLEASDGSYSYRVVAIRQNNNQVYDNTVYNYTPTLVVPEYALSIPDLIAGNYTIRITDANSSDPTACLFEQQFELRNISVSANVIAPTCSGADNGSIELTVEGGSGNYDFSWTDLALNPISTDQNIYGLEPGTYIVTILDIDEACSFTREYTIAYQNTLSVNEVVSDVTCHGGSNGSITATANGGVAPYNYLWAKFDGTNYIPIINTQTISGQTIGTYKVTVTDFNGCQVSKEDIEIEQPDDFTISSHVINNHVDCYGGANGSFTVVPDRVDNFEYSIDGINWQVSPTFTSLVAGGYQVSMRDRDRPGPDYCAKYDVENVIITEPEALAVSLKDITNVSCFSGDDGAIEVTVDGGTVAGSYDYQWYRVTGTGNIALTLGSVNPATTLTAGDYRVRVTDDNSCSIWSDVYTVTEPASTPSITVVTNNAVTTPGGNDGSITISISGGTPGYDVVWYDVDGTTVLDNDVLSIYNLPEGTYKVEVEDNNGCVVSRDITVSEPGAVLQLSLLSIVNPVLCPVAQPGSIELEANGGTQPYAFTLTKRPGIAVTTGIVSANYITYSGLGAGIYDARVVDDNGVVVEVNGITLEVPDALDLSIVNKKDVVCFGESNGEISFTAEGGTLSDNGTAGDPSDDYHTYVIVSEVGLPSYSGQIIDGDTEIISTLPAGDYSLTVTDSKGCSATTDFTVSQPEDLSISVNNISPVTCNGGNNGAISTTVNGRPGGTLFTYSWEFSTDQVAWNPYAGTSLSISGLEAGWYRITATETATSCSGTSSEIQINEPAAVSLAIVQVNDISTCHGDDSGSIVLSVSGGTAPYMVKYGTVEESWSGLNNYVAAGLVAGDYTFEITDNQGCFVEESATISEPTTPFVASVAGSGITCETPNTGWIDLSVSGGVDSNGALAGGFSYGVQVIRQENNQIFVPTVNDPVAGVIEIDNLPAGTYTIRVWDDNSTAPDRCGKTFEVELRNMVVNANVKHPTCTGLDNGSIKAIVTGGSGNFNYAWTGPGTYTSTDPLIENLEPGSYELTVTDNINSCSSAPRTYIINYAYTLSVTTNVTDVSCYGGSNGSATAIPSGVTAPYFYLWERQNGASWLPLTNTATLNNRAADTYRVTVTDANNCEVVSADVDIDQPADFDIASISYTREMVSCYGGADGSFTVSTDRPGNFEYSIDAVNWQILPTFDNQAAGSYRISIRDMDQPAPYCAKYEVETATILEADPIVISLDNQVNVNCFGDATGLLKVVVSGGTVATDYDYQWYKVTSTGNIPQAGKTAAEASSLSEGSYFVKVLDDHGCPATSDVYTITQPASAPLVSVVSNQSVSALNGNDGSITVAISGGTPGYSIAWSGVDYEGNAVVLTQNVVTLNNLNAGTYIATVTDDKGCTDDITITVSQPGDALTLSEISVNPQPCNGATNGSMELTAAGGALPYTFTLIRNPGTEITAFSVSGNKAFYNGLAAGFYTARVRDNNGNVVELPDLELTQPLPVEIYDITPTNITCFGENDGSIEFSIRGGTPHATDGYSFILRPENGSDIIGSGDVNILEEDLNPGNYTLSVYDVTNTCFAEHSFTLTQPDEIIIITKKITPVSCNGESDGSIRIEVSGGIGGAYSYEWFLYNTTTSSWDAIASSNTAWLQSRGAGRYKVEVTELGGSTCTKESVDFELSQPVVLSASATAIDVNTCMGDNSGSIKVEVSGGVGPYLVDYGIGTQYGAGPEFFIEDLVADDYTLVVTDNNGSGCQAVANATVGEPDEALSVTTPVVTYSCVPPSAETHSVSFNINGGVGINNGTDDEFSYDIEVVNLVTSGRKTKKIALTIDQPVVVNLDDLNLITGNYRLIVTDAQAAASANCAAVEHVFTISRMAVSHVVSPVSCPGAANGAIDISVTGGSGNYAYAWEKDGLAMTETSQDLSGLSDGNYTLTLTDVSEPDRCPITRTYTVSNAKTLVVESSIEPIKCFGGNNGAIRISGVTNAAPGLSYYWNGSAVAGTNELTGLAAGDYSVEIIDGDGCRVQVTFTVTQPTAPLFVDLSQSLNCAQDTRSITAAVTGGTGPFVATSFAWSGPGTFTRSVDGRSISGITTGGNYKVQVTDALGCQTSKIITVFGKVQVIPDVAPINCNGGTVGSINLDVKGGSGDYTYIWTKDGLAFAQTTKDINNLGAGTYTVTVTDNLQDCNLTTKYSVTLNDIIVSQPDLIEYVSVTPKDITRCYGDLTGEIAIRVKGGSGTYFLDYNEDGINDYTSFDGEFKVTGLAAGNYQLRVTDANGCATDPALKPVAIAQPDDPLTLVVDQTNTTIDCINPNTGVIEFAVTGGNMDASGNPSYKISVSGQLDRDVVLEGSQTYSGLPAGTYIIQVQDMLASEPAACTIVRETVVLEHIQITGNEIPNACAVTSNNIGAIRNIQITGTSDIPTWQGDAAPSNSVWYWDETGGALGGDPVTDNTQLNQENLPVGEYVLVVIDNGRGGCEVRKTFIVGAQSTLEIKGNAVPISCYGAGDGLISGIEVTGAFNYSYSWTGSGVDNSLVLSDGQKNLEAGTYVLSISDNDNGCQVSKSFEITEPGEITYDLVETVESCSPYRRGVNLILPAGETRTFDYTWTGTDGVVGNTQNLTGLKKGGQYSVIVSDYSCHVPKSISIADTVKIKTDVTQLDCFGDANGVIAVPTITGGSGNFSYEWTKDGIFLKAGTDISDINISGLSVGVYELTLTDNGTSDVGGACEYVISVPLKQPDLIVATGDIKHITCNGAQNGAINISVSGGTAPYTYIWTTIDGVGLNKFSQNQSGLSGGTYTVQVKDAKGCISAETQFIVNEVDAIDFDLNRDDTDCDGTNGKLEIDNLSGGSNKYKYLWSTNDGSGIVQISPTQTLTGGTYTVKVWDEDYPACFLEKQATLTKAITIAPTVTNQTCNSNANGSIDIAVTGGVAPYTYEWTPAVGITNINKASQSNLTKGTYELKVIDSRPVADGGPCDLTIDVDVDLDYDIQADVNVNHVSCKGGNNGSISLTKVTGAMAGNYAFLWTGLPVGKVPTNKNQSGLPAGSYTVKITDKNSDCFINKTIVITEPDDAVSITSINVTDIDCKGDASGTIEVVATGGTPFNDGSNNYYKYAWVGPGIGLVQDSPSQSNLAAGTYTVTVTDSLGGTDGCVAFSGNIVVTEPLAAIAATVQNIQHVSAQGGSDGAIQLSTSGGSGSLHYAWSGMAFDGITVIPVTHIGSNPAGLVAGKYSVDITDDKFCSFTLENIIVEEPGLPLTMEVTTKNIQPCNGNANGEIHIDAFGGTSPYTITLLQGATIINEVVANQMNEVGLSQGVYVVTIKDANNVVITKNDVEILEPTPLQLSASVNMPQVLCTGSATGSLSYTIAGGTAPYSVLVTGPGSYKNEAKDIVAGTYPLGGLAAGTYRVLMIDNNSGNGTYLLHENCYKETTVTITEPKALVTISDNSTICKGESTNIRLSVSDYTGVYPLTIKLSDGSTKTLASANQTFAVSPLVDTQYTVTQVLDNAGTCIQGSGAGSALVTVNDIPWAHIELIGDDEVCLGEEISFSIHFEGEGPFNVSYTNGTVQTNLINILAKDTLIKVVPLESTTYQIAAMSDANCTGTFTGAAVVVVNELPSVTMDIAPDDAVICKGESSEIRFNFPTGTADYRVSFTENGVLRSVNATPLVAGAYFMAVSPKVTTAYKLISVRDANNCEVAVNEVTQTITVNESPKSAGDIMGKTLVCQGEQLVTYKVDSIGFADSYVWEVPASMGTIASQNDTIITINFKDDFVSGSISVKGKNDCGEGVAFVLPITTKKLPLKPDAPSGTISMCAGSSGITYSVPAVDYAIKYEWLLPIGFKYANGDSTGNSIMVDVKEGYTDFVGDISVIAINNCGTSEVSDALTVRVNPFPLAVADKGNLSNRACASTYTLNAVDPGAGYTGVWSSNRNIGTGLVTTGQENNPTASIYNLSQGPNTFIWTVTNDFTGCSTSDEVIIYNDQVTVFAVADNYTVCDGKVNLTGTPLSSVDAPLGTGVWSTPDGASITPANTSSTEATNMARGENTFTWTIQKGACPSTATVKVMNNQPTEAIIYNASDVIISLQDLPCGTASTNIKGSVPEVGEIGYWIIESGSVSIDDINSSDIQITNIPTGDHILSWNILNGSCASTTTVKIRNNKFVVDAGMDDFTCDGTMQLKGTDLIGGATGKWTTAFGTFDDATKASTTVRGLTQTGDGVNVLRWTVRRNGCESFDTVTITNNQPTEAQIQGDVSTVTVCGDEYTLDAVSPKYGDGIWTVVSGRGIFDDPKVYNTKVSGIVNGENIYRWTVYNKTCSSPVEFRVTNLHVDAYAGADTAVCGTIARLHAIPAPIGASGAWSVVNDGISSGSFRPTTLYGPGRANENPSPSVESLSSGNNQFVWTITNDDCISTDTVVVSNNAPSPVSAAPTGGTDDDFFTLVADPLTTPGSGLWTLLEGRGTILNPTSPTTKVENLFPNINRFRWTVTNLNCSDYVDVEVKSGVLAQANAGWDQLELCEDYTTLQANLPANTFGEWTIQSGGVQFEDDDQNKAKVNIYNIRPGRNVLKWTLKFAGSGTQSTSDTIVIINNKPSDAYAGNDITECGDSTQLNAQDPEIGKVFWTILSGGGTFSDDSIAKPTVTNLAPGENMLKYQIQNNMCFSYDTLKVFNMEPSEAIGGENQTVCADSAEIRPTIPKYGNGTWRVIKGAGKGKDNKGNYTNRIEGNYVYALAPGENKLVWEVQVPGAAASCIKRDTITIVNNQPSLSYAGQNRSVCVDTVTLSGSVPLDESKGMWTLISGSGQIADSSQTTTLVTKLGLGKNRFRWTVDKNGCTSISEVEIANNFIKAIAGDIQINCADTAALQANNPSPGIGSWGVKGGSGSAQFNNNADPYTIVRNLDKGENILTWTIDHKGCPSVSEVKIVNNAPSKADAGDNKATCVPTFVLGASDPEVGTGIWTIRSGGGKFADDLKESTRVDSLKFGDNIFRWTVEHEGCYSTDDVQISYNTIEAKVAGDQEICSDRAFLEANSALPGLGTWTVVGGGSQAKFIDSHDPVTEAFDLAKGKNRLKWTINNKGCITSKEVEIINHTPSTAYAGNTQEFCREETVLDATPVAAGLGTGKWEILTGSAIIPASEINNPKANITGLSKGENVLRWIVTSDNGLCDSQDDVRIINNQPSIPYAGASDEYCSPTVVLKAATPDFGTGRWSIVEGGGDLNDPALPNATISNLQEGKNILRWTISQGQCSLFSEIEVINNTPRTANAGPDIDDCKDYATLDANIAPPGTGYWTLTSGNAVFADKSNAKTLVNNLTFGANILRWNIQKGKCISSDEIIVNNNIPDQAKAGTDRETCENYLTLNANDPTTGIGTWHVLSGNGDFDDLHSPISIVRNLKLGENIFKWVVSYGSCTTEDEVEINSNKAAPYAGEDDVSYLPSYDLKASNPGKLGAKWSLVAGDGIFEDETFYNTRVNGLREGINTYRWLMDINGCVTFDDVSIEYKLVPDASFKVDTFQGCYPLRVQFTNQSIGGSSYSWDFGDERYSSERNPVHTFRQPGEYTVTLTAPGPDNVDGTYQMKILVHDHPVADFTYGPDVLYVPGDVLRAYSNSVDAHKYLWDFGDGNTSNQVNPAYKYKDKGFYTITLEVTSRNNCVDKMVKVNAVEVRAEGFVVFPNSFMPRPDGGTSSTVGGGETNSVFRPVYKDVETYKLQIFNRWGQLLYEGDDIVEGWNGFFNGQLSPQAVYVYKVTGTFISGKEFNESGSVLLVR